ncbi:unnamed protein product [Caenorhabditis sp. 36 PRJEB53466]|nr:unnamed protein product [Caenorhabditis sp. 36 PRJEB53466]
MSNQESMSVSVVLSDSIDSLWSECFKLGHEMILTCTGRRIFPLLEYKIEGLDANKMYSICLHLDLVDNKKLRFSNRSWIETLSPEMKRTPKRVWHHSGAMTGRDWMEKPVSFDQVRITNKLSKEEENPSYIHLHTQHRYIPVLSIYESVCEANETEKLVSTHRITHSQFITVTAYHMPEINTLKTNNNPYSTGSRKDRRRGNQSPSSSSSEESSRKGSVSPPPAKKIKEETASSPFPILAPQPDLNMLQVMFYSQMAYSMQLMNPMFSQFFPYFPSPNVTPPSFSPPVEKEEKSASEAEEIIDIIF